jgi:hypothetical protein
LIFHVHEFAAASFYELLIPYYQILL